LAKSGQPFGTFSSPASPKKATPLQPQHSQHKATRYSSAIMPKRTVFGDYDDFNLDAEDEHLADLESFLTKSLS